MRAPPGSRAGGNAAGARGGDLSVVSLNLSGLNIDPSMQPRMTVTWNDADIHDVLAGFAAFSGRTIVVGKTVDGKVTLSKSADEAKAAWKEEERNSAMFEYGDRTGGDKKDTGSSGYASSTQTGSTATGSTGSRASTAKSTGRAKTVMWTSLSTYGNGATPPPEGA